MEKCQVILWLFILANEQPAKAVHPRVRSFHLEASCFEPRLPLDGLGLFSAWANVAVKPNSHRMSRTSS